VHPTSGSLRVFKHFSWLDAGSVKLAFSHPAQPPVTQAVRWLVKALSENSAKKPAFFDKILCPRKIMDKNSLITNFAKYKSQEENYLTEAFASLARYLVENEKPIAFRLFSLLTQRRFDLTKYHHHEIFINTQIRTIFGRPDIEVITPDCLIYIENKIEARLEDRQILRYQRDLELSDKSKTLLILVTKYRMSFSAEEPDCHIRWHEIANCLESTLHRLKSKDSYNKVSQFIDFLHFRYLATQPATTKVSLLLKKYIQREGKNSLSFHPIRRSSEFKDDADLIPLRKLLNVMAFSIEKAFPQDHFGFSNRILGLNGQFNGIGFDIAYRYDFFIDVDQPDILLFRANTKGKLKTSSHVNSGKLVKVRGITFWFDTLKTTKKEFLFFKMSFNQQANLLSDFLKKSRINFHKVIGSSII
jgi:hypothetical protein